jgi:hypothetical protein
LGGDAGARKGCKEQGRGCPSFLPDEPLSEREREEESLFIGYNKMPLPNKTLIFYRRIKKNYT